MSDSTDERYRRIERTLKDVKAGPIIESRKMSYILGFGYVWLGLNVLFVGFHVITLFAGAITEFMLLTLLSLAFINVFIGVCLFSLGWLRRSRYVMGKRLERVGLSILVLPLLYSLLLFITKSVFG